MLRHIVDCISAKALEVCACFAARVVSEYGPAAKEKQTEMEGEHQKNSRTGFFDLWRTLSRRFSVIHKGYVSIAAVS